MLGNPGDGWRVSLTTLMNERVSIGGLIPQRGTGVISELIKVWSDLPEERRDPARRDEVTQVVDPRRGPAADEHPCVGQSQARRPRTGGVDRQGGGRRAQQGRSRRRRLAARAGRTLYGDYTMQRPRFSSDSDSVQKAFLRSRANSIEGGTSEVMYNILGERVLGLPGDVRVDRDIPWSQVPRS